MHTSALLLHALKGTCALNCLAALHLAGPQPLTQRAIMDLTGFDDAAVRKGLHTLRVLGLATGTGDDRRTAWQLAPMALELAMPLAPVWPSPENADSARLFKEEEKEEEPKNQKSVNSDSSLMAEASPEKRDSGAGGRR